MKAGQYITDGTAIFILDDVRDGNRVGDIVLKPTLNDGYIKANGATVKASEYPRLLKWAQDNNLCVSADYWIVDSSTKYVYNAGADTLRVPNVVGRVLQGGNSLETKEAGLPNIKGILWGISGDNGGLDDGGALHWENTNYHLVQTTENVGAGGHRDIAINASRSSQLYGASNTVQPPACCLIAQIKY